MHESRETPLVMEREPEEFGSSLIGSRLIAAAMMAARCHTEEQSAGTDARDPRVHSHRAHRPAKQLEAAPR